MSALDRMLGGKGDSVQCQTLHNASIHWYPTGAKPGDRCVCGEKVMQAPAPDAVLRPDAKETH